MHSLTIFTLSKICYNLTKMAKQNYQLVISAARLKYERERERERERVTNARRLFGLIKKF